MTYEAKLCLGQRPSHILKMHKVNPNPQFEKLSKHLFWDVDRSKLDFEKDAPLVVQRALEYGMIEDWIIIRDYYGVPRIAEIAMDLRDLDPISINFIAHVSDTDIKKYRCYILRQSLPKHWIY